MLDIKYIRENPEKIKENNKNRRVNVDLGRFLELDKKRAELIQKVDTLRAEKKKPKGKPTPEDLKKLQEIKGKEDKLAKELGEVEKEYRKIYLTIPNLSHPDMPVGKDESANVVVKKVGDIPKFDFKPKDHLELGEQLDLIDMANAAKIAGSRFYYLKNELVLLQYSLLQLVFSVLTNEDTLKEIAKNAGLDVSTKPFTPILPPDMLKPKYLEAMGRLEPKDDKYYIPTDDLYLAGSAEHSIGVVHANETLDEKDLPIRYIGFSTAFRREAGSYGKDVKGILRAHQFDKAEIVSFTTADTGEKEQDFIVAVQEYLLQQIKIPYQTVNISTGDTANPDYRQLDVECWLPGQNKYRETHSADYNTDYQARRLGTKVRKNSGDTEFAHMNDATVFAMGRALIAILENYQQADGSVKIPEVLQKYMGGLEKISRNKKQ